MTAFSRAYLLQCATDEETALKPEWFRTWHCNAHLERIILAVDPAASVAESGPHAVSELECLYWVGCAAAFDDRNKRVARAVVTCLEAAGVKYAVLGQEESWRALSYCCEGQWPAGRISFTG